METPLFYRTRLANENGTILLIAGIVLSLASFVDFGLGFAPTPNIPGVFQEHRLEKLLNSHPNYADVLARLNQTHADWHKGRDYQDGGIFVPLSQSDHCSIDCTTALQVSYLTWGQFCFVTGDRFTILFDGHGRLSSWHVAEVVDGC